MIKKTCGCRMKKLSIVFFTVLMAGCSPVNSLTPFDHEQASIVLQQRGASKPSRQMFHYNLPDSQGWNKTTYIQPDLGSFVLLVPTGQQAWDWREAIQARIVPDTVDPTLTAAQLTQQQQQLALRHCTQSNMRILRQSANEVLYQLNKSGCDNSPNQQEIGKVFNGANGVYFIRYIINDHAISEKRRQQMSDVIQSTTLVKNPRM